MDLLVEPYYHVAELDGAVRSVLRHRPRVVVIEVVGWLALAGTSSMDLSRLPRGIRSAADRVKFFRRAKQRTASKSGSSELIVNVPSGILGAAVDLLRPLMPRLPRPTLAEYESCVSSVLEKLRDEGIAAVVQGPGAGNFATQSKGRPADLADLYRAVGEMARRVAEAHGALFVDRWDTVTSTFFIPGTTRPTAKGHSVWGHLLADHLLREGLV